MPKDSSGSAAPRRELLEVEDEEVRQKRLQSLLENINFQSSSTSSSKSPFRPPTFPLNTPSKPYPVPPSELLSRAEAFLPLLAASNAELEAADPATLDIENVEGEGQPYIEMNLGLGVFEQRRHQNEEEHSSDSRSDDDEDEPDSDETDSESSSEDGSTSRGRTSE